MCYVILCKDAFKTIRPRNSNYIFFAHLYQWMDTLLVHLSLIYTFITRIKLTLLKIWTSDEILLKELSWSQLILLL